MTEALFTTVEAIEGKRQEAGRRYLEFLRVPDLSVGLYRLEAGRRGRGVLGGPRPMPLPGRHRGA
jgi:hypothetical protein